jgi:catechol 2,3-dioxygenase-like lactoylglutathione lyase family enzyme
MKLLDHVSISVRDLAKSRPFYLTVMAALDATVAYDQDDAMGFGERNLRRGDAHSYITIRQSPDAVPDSARHWCFRAETGQAVRNFDAAGLAAGGSDAGAPGLRSYHKHYYAAFLLDSDGNKIEAVCHHGDS